MYVNGGGGVYSAPWVKAFATRSWGVFSCPLTQPIGSSRKACLLSPKLPEIYYSYTASSVKIMSHQFPVGTMGRGPRWMLSIQGVCFVA